MTADSAAVSIRAQSAQQPPTRVLMTHPHDGHGENETCLDCTPEVTVEDVARVIEGASEGCICIAHAQDAASEALARFTITERKEQ